MTHSISIFWVDNLISGFISPGGVPHRLVLWLPKLQLLGLWHCGQGVHGSNFVCMSSPCGWRSSELSAYTGNMTRAQFLSWAASQFLVWDKQCVSRHLPDVGSQSSLPGWASWKLRDPWLHPGALSSHSDLSLFLLFAAFQFLLITWFPSPLFACEYLPFFILFNMVLCIPTK